MINCLIVDDDSLIRQSISLMITENFSKYEYKLFEASDGQKAFETACAQQIDIILTDIKMPFCTGIELMKKLNSENFQGKIIVLSGYDDYSFVRDALKNGASDYLLKPIVKSEFLTLLTKCFDEIIYKQSYIKNHQEEIKVDANNLYKNQYEIDEIFNQNFTNLTNFDKKGQNLMILINFDSTSSANFSFCSDFFTSKIDENFSLIQGEHDKFWILIFNNPSAKIEQTIKTFENLLQTKNYSYSKSDYFKISDLKLIFEQLSLKLQLNFYNLAAKTPDFIEPYPYEKTLSELEDAAVNFDIASFKKFLALTFELINFEKPSVQNVKKLFQDFIYKLMQKNSKYIRIIGQYKISKYDIFICINNSSSLSSLQDNMLSIFNIYMKKSDSEDENHEANYIRMAKEYVKKEYMHDISLNDVSKVLLLHPNYFSSVFKQKTGISFIEYVRKIRIEKACELMKNTNLHLYEIAEQVGYNDTIQFNRAFNKETGISPSKYQKGK